MPVAASTANGSCQRELSLFSGLPPYITNSLASSLQEAQTLPVSWKPDVNQRFCTSDLPLFIVQSTA
jgi:hypothetical protein